MTKVAIHVDHLIDEGVYICADCVQQHGWTLELVEIETEGIEAPLCYNCGASAWERRV